MIMVFNFQGNHLTSKLWIMKSNLQMFLKVLIKL